MDATFSEAAFWEEIEKIEETDDEHGVLVAGLFPSYEQNWFNKAVAELCYSQHQGSGLNFTPADVENFDLDEIEFYLNWLAERRKEEARIIEQATRR